MQRNYEKAARLSVMVFVCLAGIAQRDKPRSATTYTATNAGAVWVVYDDGGLVPVLSGHYHTGSVHFILGARPYDIGAGVFRTVAVGGGKTQRVEIYYLENCDTHIRAKIGNQEVKFFEQAQTNR